MTPSSMNYQNDCETSPIIPAEDSYLQLPGIWLRNAKGKFNISVRLFEWQSECERTGNDPYLRKYAVLFPTRNPIPCLPCLCREMLRIIKNYLSQMKVVNMFSGFLSSSLDVSIILIYFIHPAADVFLALIVGKVGRKVDNFICSSCPQK